MRKSYEKLCPVCNCKQTYHDSYSLNRAIRDDAKCKKCVFKGRSISEKQKEFLRQRTGSKNPMFGKSLSLETKMKLSKMFKGRKGNLHSEETKQKLRIIRANWILKNKGGPVYNPKACEYLNKLNEDRGWNLQHAENGGEYYIKELGYWVDAYDKTKNIVVEYDEPRHYNVSGELKIRDINRQNKIISLLNCQFYRFNEITGQLNIFSLSEPQKVNFAN